MARLNVQVIHMKKGGGGLGSLDRAVMESKLHSANKHSILND